MDTALLRPRTGVIVRDPDTRQPLDAKGERKAMTSYWRRRLRDGDVQLVTEPAAPKASPKKDA